MVLETIKHVLDYFLFVSGLLFWFCSVLSCTVLAKCVFTSFLVEGIFAGGAVGNDQTFPPVLGQLRSRLTHLICF